MKTTKLLFTMITVLLLLSCESETFENSVDNSQSESSLQSMEVQFAMSELLTLVRENDFSHKLGSLPNNIKHKSDRSKLGVTNIEDYDFYQSFINQVINGEDYECGPTKIDFYIRETIEDWTEEDWELFLGLGQYVLFDAVYVFDNEDGGQYYGPDGEFTNNINRTFKDNKRFWNIPTDIILRDAHGSIFNDTEKTTSLMLLYGLPPELAAFYATLMQTVYGSDKYWNFNHPLLSFNAFAARANSGLGTPKKIVMGDGIMTGYDDLGYGDVAPQSILAHEYGHHVQYAKNVPFYGTPESTRRTELMADAIASYYLTHKRGATMNWKRVKQFLEVFYEIGDCSFSSSGHHGTPNQRMKAAKFGYDVANNTKKNGKILTAEEFIILFMQELPILIEPDA